MKKYIYILGLVLILTILLVVVLANRPPQLELKTEEDSVPAFGETEETKTEATKETEEKNETVEKDFAFTVSHGSAYLGSALNDAALNSEKMKEDGICHLPIFKIENKEELASFQSSYGSLLSGGPRDEFPAFETTIKKYDEAFFEKNTLLVVYVTPDSGSYRYGVKDVAVDGEKLVVSIEQTNRPTAVTMDLVGWVITVELPKETTAGKTILDATLTRPQ